MMSHEGLELVIGEICVGAAAMFGSQMEQIASILVDAINLGAVSPNSRALGTTFGDLSITQDFIVPVEQCPTVLRNVVMRRDEVEQQHDLEWSGHKGRGRIFLRGIREDGEDLRATCCLADQ